MTIEFFNEHYAHLPDTEDASNVIGVLPGVATIGDIRVACAGQARRFTPANELSGAICGHIVSIANPWPLKAKERALRQTLYRERAISDLVRSNDDLRNDNIENDLLLATLDEIRFARPLAVLRPETFWLTAGWLQRLFIRINSENISQPTTW